MPIRVSGNYSTVSPISISVWRAHLRTLLVLLYLNADSPGSVTGFEMLARHLPNALRDKSTPDCDIDSRALNLGFLSFPPLLLSYLWRVSPTFFVAFLLLRASSLAEEKGRTKVFVIIPPN